MPKSLEDRIRDIELSMVEMKGDIKLILNDLLNHKKLDERVRALEDDRNKFKGVVFLMGVIASAIVSIIIKLI